jgi:HK97 family phage prohead protease
MIEVKNIRATELKSEGRTIIGYAAAFGNIDSYGDIIERGAFDKTIQEGRDRIKTFYNHMTPIGKPSAMREDDKGLYTESVVSRTAKGDEILELVRDGVITEMSIGYQTIKYDNDDKGFRHLKELKLYEFGPVDFAANEKAVISGVKSLADMLRQGKNGTMDIASINDAISTLQGLVGAAEPSGDTQPDTEPSDDTQGVIDTCLSDIGDLIHEIADAVHI